MRRKEERSKHVHVHGHGFGCGAGYGPYVLTVATCTCIYIYIHVLMRDEKEERKKQAWSNKPKEHSTPKAVTFPKKNELPRVRLETMTLYTLDRAFYH